MNKVILTGNLTRDPERRESQGGHAITTFTVATPKKTKNPDGTYGADFIKCVAWRNTAEFISKYFTKGSRIELSGSIATSSYEKDGKKVFITEVNVERPGLSLHGAQGPAGRGHEAGQGPDPGGRSRI